MVIFMLGRCVFRLNLSELLSFVCVLRCGVGLLIMWNCDGFFSVIWVGIGSVIVVCVSLLYVVWWLFDVIMLLVVWYVDGLIF